jgi:hypothetical protein
MVDSLLLAALDSPSANPKPPALNNSVNIVSKRTASTQSITAQWRGLIQLQRPGGFSRL